jgi:acetyl-CoA acyltransferase 2
MFAIFIVAAKRTPFGAFGGALAKVLAIDLGVHAAALASGNIDPALVDIVYFGNVIQTGSHAAYLAKNLALKSGCKVTTPSLTLNRLCGSGFETVIQAADEITMRKHTHLVIGTVLVGVLVCSMD